MTDPVELRVLRQRGTVAPGDARAAFRDGLSVPTCGWCTHYAQANLIAVPGDWAYDVLLFCQRNPKACPLLDVTDRGASAHRPPRRRRSSQRPAAPSRVAPRDARGRAR